MKKEGMLTRMVTVLFMLVLVFVLFNSSVYAFDLSTIFTRGNTVTGSEDAYASTLSDLVKEIGTGVIKPVGYLIFAIITVVLGVQYIWSGYNSKSRVKESLPAFICAVVVFYLSDQVLSLATGIFSTSYGSVQELTGNIWVNVCNVVQILAFAGILFIGVKYMMESAEGRAKIKERLAPMVIGIVFVFCAANVVSSIIKIGDQLI